MIINKDTISVKDLLDTWSNYVDWDRFHKNGAVVTNIDGYSTLFNTILVTIEFPVVDFMNKGVEK